MSQFVFFKYYCVVVDLFQSWKNEEWILMAMKIRLKLPNEQDLNTIICIFCNKVTKGGIYRHKHLVGGHRNAKKM